jgi:hypothetical protein
VWLFDHRENAVRRFLGLETGLICFEEHVGSSENALFLDGG